MNLAEEVIQICNEDAAQIADDKVTRHEQKLKASGYIRSKDINGGEYQFKWTKKGQPTHIVNYRFGKKGYASHWKEG